MAEGIPAAPAPEPVAAPAPAVAAPAPATLSESPPAPIAPAPEAPVEPAPETPPAESPPAEPAVPPTDAPAVPAAEGEKPAAEAAAVPEVKPEAPKYAEILKVPEGVTLGPDKMGAYSELATKYNLSPEAAQDLMDFGAGFVKETQQKMAQQQIDVFAETRRGWVQEAQNQYGNKFDTTVNDAKSAITQLVPDAKARAALWNVLAFTGAGDHPAVVGAFAAAAKKLRERGAPAKGLPANGAKNGSPADRRYGGKQPQS